MAREDAHTPWHVRFGLAVVCSPAQPLPGGSYLAMGAAALMAAGWALNKS